MGRTGRVVAEVWAFQEELEHVGKLQVGAELFPVGVIFLLPV